MLKNYFKLGFRNLLKNRLSSFINVLGLALAVACCLVVFKFFDFSMHTDDFDRKIDHLFTIERVSTQNGNEQKWGNSPAPMGAMLKNDFPQIKNVARFSYSGVIIKQGDNVFSESVSFVDDSFYKMFDFPVKYGNPKTFTDEDGIVLTSELSVKLFGKQNPVGKNVSLIFNVDGVQKIANFTVKGMLDKKPAGSSFYFSALAPYSRMAALGMDKPGDWKQTVASTFIEADNQSAFDAVQKKSGKYLKLYNAANPDDKISAYNFQPLKNIAFHGANINNDIFFSSNIAAYMMLLVIGIATLIMVYFNYMNIAVASASTRLKEIGIRKVMGSRRQQIIFQFIFENLILCTVGVAAGLFLGRFVSLPLFSQICNVDLTADLFNNYRTWVALLVLIVLSAISGASYPAFYISGFNPVNIIKGNSKTGSKNRFRKVLLGFQFFLSFIAISTALAFMQQTKSIKARPWGYQPENNVVVPIDKAANLTAFEDELKNASIVKTVSGAEEALGSYTRQLVIDADGAKQTVNTIGALPGFATQMGIKILKGRDLSKDLVTDQTDAVLVNQVFIKQMRWKTAVGKSISYAGHKYTVVGEVNDFHFDNFNSPIGPLMLLGCKPADVNFVYVKTTGGIFSNAHKSVEQIWKRVNPNLPFICYYQDTVFDGYFIGFTQVSEVLAAASLIMIVISITGIFGLALLILGRKMKEISVRKVLGAGIVNIIFLINKEFLYAIGFAVLFGLPISYWMTGSLFKILITDPSVSFSPLIFSLLALVVMTAVSVSWHIYKAHTANPSRYLKDE
jgi:ABC-type lipoprotein release transport system permease subunit